MGERVLRTAAELGVAGPGMELLAAVHRAAMAIRDRRVPDDHDPRYLHPSRTALILMQDLGAGDPDTLAGALLAESRDAELMVPAEAAPREARAALAYRDGVPLAGGDEVAETLVVAPEAVRRIALAERLDHLRHAHLWADVEARRRAHAEAEAVYLPVAERTHPELARRLAWWCRMFARRHLA